MHRQTEEDQTSAHIAALPAKNKAQLLKIWEHTFPTPPPAKLRKELMVPILAYRMQEAVHGGLSRTARTRLRRLIEERPTTSARFKKKRSASQPASKLIPSWGGEIHEVLITPEGYVYRGETFRKLSPFAGRITGTQWSGLLRYQSPGEETMTGKVVRCAVYTRKSSEEGLDQSFNSLHAQREACEAYVLSQKHEGWGVVGTEYDDGGFFGGNMDRPGLRKLLADIAARRVDTVVVYKVDRLTRSLADFAKIVEQFDGQGVSFVSVTQQFNTTSSMGRLTLNVLLSFAQFEREVTGERIRDKIAASKRKGMWMGGSVPLGYDPHNRTLTINEAEAEQVRTIYQTYLELGCVSRLRDRLEERGIRSKSRISGTGRTSGNAVFSRWSLYEMLQNPLYLGEIRHKKDRYPGQHQAIMKEGAVGSGAEATRVQPASRCHTWRHV